MVPRSMGAGLVSLTGSTTAVLRLRGPLLLHRSAHDDDHGSISASGRNRYQLVPPVFRAEFLPIWDDDPARPVPRTSDGQRRRQRLIHGARVELLLGAEANYRDCIWSWSDCSSVFRADMLVGFRYLHLDEDLLMTENAVRLTQSVNFPDEVAGTRVFLFDEFRTKNDFYGGQIGTVMGYTRGPWSADLRGTVAVGNTTQTVTVDGGQVRGPLANGGGVCGEGGLLALPTNIGTRSRNEFSVVPEIGINLGYQVTDHWKTFIGYNFLYWSNVVRPADQIDTTIDVTRIPRFVPPGVPVQPDGPRPAPLFRSSDFWAQGVSFGVEYRW